MPAPSTRASVCPQCILASLFAMVLSPRFDDFLPPVAPVAVTASEPISACHCIDTRTVCKLTQCGRRPAATLQGVTGWADAVLGQGERKVKLRGVTTRSRRQPRVCRACCTTPVPLCHSLGPLFWLGPQRSTMRSYSCVPSCGRHSAAQQGATGRVSGGEQRREGATGPCSPAAHKPPAHHDDREEVDLALRLGLRLLRQPGQGGRVGGPRIQRQAVRRLQPPPIPHARVHAAHGPPHHVCNHPTPRALKYTRQGKPGHQNSQLTKLA